MMHRYQVILPDELNEVYTAVANDLSMSIEQVLTAALQLYAERLTLNSYDGVCNTELVQQYEETKSCATR